MNRDDDFMDFVLYAPFYQKFLVRAASHDERKTRQFDGVYKPVRISGQRNWRQTKGRTDGLGGGSDGRCSFFSSGGGGLLVSSR